MCAYLAAVGSVPADEENPCAADPAVAEKVVYKNDEADQTETTEAPVVDTKYNKMKPGGAESKEVLMKDIIPTGNFPRKLSKFAPLP